MPKDQDGKRGQLPDPLEFNYENNTDDGICQGCDGTGEQHKQLCKGCGGKGYLTP